MPCKVVFFFNQFDRGWSEVYYVGGNDPFAAATSFDQKFLKSMAAMRHVSVELVAVRATLESTTKSTFLMRPYPKIYGTRGPVYTSTPDVTSTDMVVTLTAGGMQKRVYIRGLWDEDVQRNTLGQDSPSAGLSNALIAFINELQNKAVQGRRTLRPPSGGAVWQKIGALAINTDNHLRTKFFTTQNTPEFAIGDYVVFNNVPSATLKNFPREAEIVDKVTAGGVFNYTIKYSMPGGELVQPDNMLVTKRVYLYSNITDTYSFDRFSERKTGRPFGLLRGRS